MNSSKETKLKKKIIHINYVISQIDDFFILQKKWEKTFARFIGMTKNELKGISIMFDFLCEQHINDYREFTKKKVHDNAKQWRKEHD